MTARVDATPVVVFLGQRWKETPTFHIPLRWHDGGHTSDRVEFDDGSAKVEHRTFAACGREIARWGWTERPGETATRDYFDIEHTSMLRRDHAEKIGRLCDRCKAAS